jgi:NADPH:quinone reductase
VNQLAVLADAVQQHHRRLLGSDDFPPAAKQQAAADLTAASRDGALFISAETLLPLERAAQAHDRVDQGTRGRVLLAIPD